MPKEKEKVYLSLIAYKNDTTNENAPPYSFKKFKITEPVTLEPGEYDLDCFRNQGDKGEYLSIKVKEPYQKDNF